MSQASHHPAEPSARLLRTLAAVPPSARILDVQCGPGRHVVPLVQLGFDTYACDALPENVATCRNALSAFLPPDEAAHRVVRAHPAALGYPDAYFDWVVAAHAFDALGSRDALLEALGEARRVLKPGGWLFVAARAIPSDFNPLSEDAGYAGDSALRLVFTEASLGAVMEAAALAEASEPRRPLQADDVLEAIYRRADPGTAG